jgi:hypothetical protein
MKVTLKDWKCVGKRVKKLRKNLMKVNINELKYKDKRNILSSVHILDDIKSQLEDFVYADYYTEKRDIALMNIFYGD